MADNKMLEKYISNLDKALGLIEDTDDVDLDDKLKKDKRYLYMILSDYIDKVEKKVKGE